MADGSGSSGATSVTIFSDLGASGTEIATEVGRALGFRLLPWEDLCQSAATLYEVEPKIVRQAFDLASLLGPSDAARQRGMAYFQAALLGQLMQGGVVYHGPSSGAGVSHQVRIHVTGDATGRARRHAKQHGLDPRAARKAVKASDSHWRWWSEKLARPVPFDHVVQVDHVEPDQAADQIVELARERRFQPTTYSTQQLQQMELAGSVRAALAALDPTLQVKLDGQTVTVRMVTPRKPSDRVVQQIQRTAEAVDGVEQVKLQLVRDVVGSFIGTGR